MQKSTTARRADGPDKDWPGSRRKRTQCANVTAQLCVGVPSSLPHTPRSHLPLVTFCNCHFIFCLYLFLCISHFSVCMPDCPSLCLSVSLSVRLSACLPVGFSLLSGIHFHNPCVSRASCLILQSAHAVRQR